MSASFIEKEEVIQIKKLEKVGVRLDLTLEQAQAIFEAMCSVSGHRKYFNEIYSMLSLLGFDYHLNRMVIHGNLLQWKDTADAKVEEEVKKLLNRIGKND